MKKTMMMMTTTKRLYDTNLKMSTPVSKSAEGIPGTRVIRRRHSTRTTNIGMTQMLVLATILIVVLTLSPTTPVRVLVVQAQPSRFIAEPVTSTYAIAGTFATNPRNAGKHMMILVEKTGNVQVIEDPDNGGDSIEILNLKDKMCLNIERGLQTVVVHPNFTENRWVYLYYNVLKEGCLADDSLDGPHNVLARFKMDPDTLMLNYDDREEIWR